VIRHTVTFKLKHQKGSIDERSFLDAARKLSSIPSVQKFEVFKEIGKKNHFDYGLSMEFEDMNAYEAYNNNPSHINFVQKFWIPQVIDFIEIDYEL